MTPRFLAFIPFVLEHETDYDRQGNVLVERDPSDPGGTTKFGIDQRSHPGENIPELTEDGAKELYFCDWIRYLCEALPSPFGEIVFDIRENGGQPVRWLQLALGVVADGFAGPKTFAAAQAASAQPASAAHVVDELCTYRESRFRALAADNSDFQRFLAGWLNRSTDLRHWATAAIAARFAPPA